MLATVLNGSHEEYGQLTACASALATISWDDHVIITLLCCLTALAVGRNIVPWLLWSFEGRRGSKVYLDSPLLSQCHGPLR